MARPVVRGTANVIVSTVATTSTTAINWTGTGALTGDSLILAVATRSGTDFTPPAGWAVLSDGTDDTITGASTASTAFRLNMWVKHGASAGDISGSVSATALASARNWVVAAFAMEPLKQGTSFVDINDAVYTASATIIPTAVTVRNDDVGLLYVTNTLAPGTITPPAAYNEVVDAFSGTGGTQASQSHLYISYGTQALAGSSVTTGVGHTRDDALTTTSSYIGMQIALMANSANVPPTVTLTATPQLVGVGETITLHAAATDPDGTVSSYAWTIVSTNTSVTAPTITNNTTATATVTPDAAGAWTAQCVVTDNGGATTTSKIGITAVDKNATVKLRVAGAWVDVDLRGRV